MNNKTIVDASVLLAILNNEVDISLLVDEIYSASISSVNYSEVVAKLFEWGLSEAEVQTALAFDLNIISFDGKLAYLAGQLRPSTKSYGLSFADRACLALAIMDGATALTADRAWAKLDINGLKVKLIR